MIQLCWAVTSVGLSGRAEVSTEVTKDMWLRPPMWDLSKVLTALRMMINVFWRRENSSVDSNAASLYRIYPSSDIYRWVYTSPKHFKDPQCLMTIIYLKEVQFHLKKVLMIIFTYNLLRTILDVRDIKNNNSRKRELCIFMKKTKKTSL